MEIAFIIAFGFTLMLCGMLAYAGRWKKWAHAHGFELNWGFSTLYLGIALLLTGLLKLLPEAWVTVESVGVIWVIFGVPSIFGLWWMPAFMLPQWFRDGREELRATDRAIANARKAVRVQRKTNKQ